MYDWQAFHFTSAGQMATATACMRWYTALDWRWLVRSMIKQWTCIGVAVPPMWPYNVRRNYVKWKYKYFVRIFFCRRSQQCTLTSSLISIGARKKHYTILQYGTPSEIIREYYQPKLYRFFTSTMSQLKAWNVANMGLRLLKKLQRAKLLLKAMSEQ